MENNILITYRLPIEEAILNLCWQSKFISYQIFLIKFSFLKESYEENQNQTLKLG